MIIVLPIAYFSVVDNIQASMVAKELREVAEYVANTFENLYILLGNTSVNGFIKKELKVPQTVKDSFYTIEIMVNETDGRALGIRAFVIGKSYINGEAWLIGGLKIKGLRDVNSYVKVIYACCECSDGEAFVGFSIENV